MTYGDYRDAITVQFGFVPALFWGREDPEARKMPELAEVRHAGPLDGQLLPYDGKGPGVKYVEQVEITAFGDSLPPRFKDTERLLRPVKYALHPAARLVWRLVEVDR